MCVCVCGLQQIGLDLEKDLVHHHSWLERPCLALVSTSDCFCDITCFTNSNSIIPYWIFNSCLTHLNLQFINFVTFASPFLPFVPSSPSLLSMTSNYHHTLPFLISLSLHHTHLAKSQSWINPPFHLFWACAYGAEQAGQKCFKYLSRASIGSLCCPGFICYFPCPFTPYSPRWLFHTFFFLLKRLTPHSPFSLSTNSLAPYLRHLRYLACSFYTLPPPHLMYLYHLHSHSLLP